MRKRRIPAVAVVAATFVVALVVFLALAALPFLTRERNQPAAVPEPPALSAVALSEVPPHGTLCVANIAIDPHSRFARLRVGTFEKPGPPLSLAISGEGYRASATERGGYADNLEHSFAIPPPAGARIVRLCLRNRGGVKIALYAADDRARARAVVTVNGRPEPTTPSIAFYERGRHSIVSRIPVTAERIATFRGPFSHTWIVWLVLVLLVLALPLGVGFAIVRGWR